MFFVATKMGPHCKDMQNHSKQSILQVFMSFLIDFRISFSDWGLNNFKTKIVNPNGCKK